jgi:hypothetical protein
MPFRTQLLITRLKLIVVRGLVRLITRVEPWLLAIKITVLRIFYRDA